MLSFLKRKAKPSITAVAPVPVHEVPQENPTENSNTCCSTSESDMVKINVYGLGKEEYWVHPEVSPKSSMPRCEHLPDPNTNCVTTINWFSGSASDEEVVLEFPDAQDSIMALAYGFGAVYGTKYIAIKFDRNLGVLEATLWGYNRYYRGGGAWQVSVCMDVQCFADYVYQLPNGDSGIDIRLCNYSFVREMIYGNNARTRVAYGIKPKEAEDAFNNLLDHLASTISVANKNYTTRALQSRANGMYLVESEAIEKLHALLEETDQLTQYCAVKQYYGVEISKVDWEKAQALYDTYVKLTVELNELGNLYYELSYVANLIHLNVDLRNLIYTINCVGLAYEKLRGLFDLLRD